MTLIAFNKPYGVICQFSAHEKHPSLADFIAIKHVYPIGRLDHDSEGLLLLTDDGTLQQQLAHPTQKVEKHYWAQVEGIPTAQAIKTLKHGVLIKGQRYRAVDVMPIAPPTNLWPRTPPIRFRRHIPTSWLRIILNEGKNRQIRRMTAAVGYPTLRLVRTQIGKWQLHTLPLSPGQWCHLKISST